MNDKRCQICGREINSESREKTCSRPCERKYQQIYNLIYGNLYRRFTNGKN